MKTILAFLVAFGASYASASITNVYHKRWTNLPNCGGQIQTKCTSGNKCWVNIEGTTCKGVRLYDDISYRGSGRYDFIETGRSYVTTLRGRSGNYYTGKGDLYVSKSRFRLASWLSSKRYYVPVFVHRTDRNRPYDKVLLRLNKR